MTILRVKDLSVDFVGQGGAVFSAVKNVSFDLARGETLAVVGESGSGKSVTALSIMQLLPYPAARHPSGSILYRDKELVGASDSTMRDIRGNRIAMIFQEPMTSLNPLHTIEKQIAEVLILHKKMTPVAARARVIELLEMVGLQKLTTRLSAYPHELSGGQRQRVMIAMALANDPDILIADEPTTAVDVTVQAQILQLLKDLQKKIGMAIIMITHDLNVVKKMADKVLVMYRGDLIEAGDVTQIFSAPAHDYTHMLISTEPKGAPAAFDATLPPVLQTRDIKVHFPVKTGLLRRVTSHVKAVDGIDLEIRPGQTIGVVGESGSGKTTLGLAILRLIRSTGTIVFQGRDISVLDEKTLRPIRSEMQIVFQDPYGSLSPRLTVEQIIGEGLQVHSPQITAAERAARVAAALKDVGLDPAVASRYPHEFSGGQRQRIAIARAMVLQPKLLILDEPTSALDVSVQAQIVDLLRGLQARYGLAYIFISHDLRVIRAMSHEVIVMRHGVAVERGSVDDIFSRPREDYTRTLISAAFNLEVVRAA